MPFPTWPTLLRAALFPLSLHAQEEFRTCSQAPAVPTGLASSAQTSASVTLTWKPARAGVGCLVTYSVYQGGTRVVRGLPATRFTVAGLLAGTSYAFSVSASDQVGRSPRSPAIVVATRPGGACGAIPSVPTGLRSLAVTASTAALAWTASSAGQGCAITYRITRNGAVAASGITGSSTTLSGLAPSTSYAITVAALDQAGASAPSAPLTVITPAGTGTALPRHILTGYWQNWNDPASGGAIRIRDVPALYDLIAVAFADATATPGAVAFNLDPGLGFTEADFIADIAAAKARGQHVIFSVGGQNGVIQVRDAASASAFASSVNALMAKYGFEGVDLDFENGLNPVFMAQALRSVKGGAILTMAPQTLDMQNSSADYFKLALSIKDLLTVCNMQYYNSGTMLGYDGKVYGEGGVDFLTALATLQLEGGLRPDQVGLGLPATPASAGSGYVSPAIVNSALDCLTAGKTCGSFKAPGVYPALRGAMTWSINYDSANGYAFAKAVKAKLVSLP